MSYDFRLINKMFLIYLLVLQYVFFVHSDSCFTSPISVSNINNCVNGVCSTNQVANFDVPAIVGSKACVVFKDISTGAIVKNVSFTITDSSFNFNVDNCYYTDDVVITSQGFCGCTGGTTATCSSCPVSLTGPGTYDCSGGVHNNNYCLFNSGTYCVKHRVTGVKRFKICELKTTPLQNLMMSIESDSSSTSILFNGIIASAGDNLGLYNATINLSTAIPPDTPKYVVYDKYDNSDFYILPSSRVNSINEFSFDKIGWAKVSTTSITIPTSFGNSVGVQIRNCQNNTFAVTYPVVQTSVLLNQMKDHLSQRMPYNSVFMDDEMIFDTGANIGEPVHSVFPFTPLSQGIAYSTTPGGVTKYYGVNINNQLVDVVGATGVINMLVRGLGGALVYANASLTTGSLDWYDPLAAVQTGATQYRLTASCLNISDCQWCLRRSSDLVCVYDYDIGIYLFPGDRVSKIRVNSATGKFETSETDLLIQSPPTLSLSALIGTASVSVMFKNFSISFSSSVADPSIVAVKQDDNFVVITALSRTSPGDCIIASTPGGIIAAQKISLTTVNTDYRLPIIALVDQNVTFNIRCFDKLASKASYISKSQDETLIPHDPIITPGFNNVDDFSQIFTHGAIASAFNPFDDFNWGTILTWSITVIIVAGIVLIGVMVWRKRKAYLLKKFKRTYRKL